MVELSKVVYQSLWLFQPQEIELSRIGKKGVVKEKFVQVGHIAARVISDGFCKHMREWKI
jgi:hypothetical protein